MLVPLHNILQIDSKCMTALKDSCCILDLWYIYCILLSIKSLIMILSLVDPLLEINISYMKRKFKQWWSTTPSISTKRTITSHLEPFSTQKDHRSLLGIGTKQYYNGWKRLIKYKLHNPVLYTTGCRCFLYDRKREFYSYYVMVHAVCRRP